jgi:hypothetical protein
MYTSSLKTQCDLSLRVSRFEPTSRGTAWYRGTRVSTLSCALQSFRTCRILGGVASLAEADREGCLALFLFERCPSG